MSIIACGKCVNMSVAIPALPSLLHAALIGALCSSQQTRALHRRGHLSQIHIESSHTERTVH